MRTLLRMLVACGFTVIAGCRQAVIRVEDTADWRRDTDHAKSLQDNEAKSNGIFVGQPKVYDDGSLRLLLTAARAKLAAMSGLNQDALVSHLGAISGATIRQQQVGIGITPALPSVSTTNTGATSSVTTDPTTGASSTVTAPTQSSTVNSAAAPTIPAGQGGIAFGAPGSVAPSSLDLLNEQMQLTNEIANLELLLEGPLSDRFVKNERFVKPRSTLGFAIAVHPRPEFKDAVAVVEVEVMADKSQFNEQPAITALLPREKTYNVLAMVDRTTSIGVGAVLGAVNVGGSFLSGNKTLYLVQDQDTVSVQLPKLGDTESYSTSFAWEFHPVLGEHYVRSGPKQTFVQLALPVLEWKDCYGSVRVRTYWRHFDQDTGLVGNVIPETVLVSRETFSIARYRLEPTITDRLTATDLGDGTLRIRIPGDFLNGTFVDVGPTRYEAGKNLSVGDSFLEFVAPAATLAQWTPKIVARNGATSPALNNTSPKRPLDQDACKNPQQSTASAPPAASPESTCSNVLAIRMIGKPIAVAIDETRSRLQLDIARDVIARANCPTPGPLPQDLLIAVGGRAFGLSDNPVQRSGDDERQTIKAIVPTALLMSNPRVTVFRPLWSDVEGLGSKANYAAIGTLESEFGLDSSLERLVSVSVNKDGDVSYLLYGNGLEHAKVVMPDHDASLTPVQGANPNRLQLLVLKKPAVAEAKKVVLLKQGVQHPFVLDLPTQAAEPSKPKASTDSPIVQNTQDLDVTVEDAGNVSTVKVDGKALPASAWKAADKSTIHLTDLKAAGVTSDQRTRELSFEYKTGADPAKVKVEIVAARVSVRQ